MPDQQAEPTATTHEWPHKIPVPRRLHGRLAAVAEENNWGLEQTVSNLLDQALRALER